jgi:DNA-binding response OmpR family regulator
MVTREELIKEFDQTEKMTVRNIDVHIFFLRKKLTKVDMAIETVWGKGYKLLSEKAEA